MTLLSVAPIQVSC